MKRAWSFVWYTAVALVAGVGGAVAGPPAALPLPGVVTPKRADAPPTSATPDWPPPTITGNHAKADHGKGDHAKADHGPGGHGEGDHGKGEHGEEAESKIIFNAEYFLMAPRRRAQDFAIIGTSAFGPVGTIKSVEGSYDSGFRIGGGYRFAGEGVDVLFNYTHFHSAGDDAILRAPPGQTVFATLTHPTGVVQVAGAKADNSINMNLFDGEVGRGFKLGEHTKVRAFGGVRFANIDQKFTALYTGGDITRDVVRRTLTFDGGGLRAGGEVTYNFLENVGVYFRGSGSLMTGRFRSRLSEVGNGVTVVDVNEKFDKVIPVIDMGVGLRIEHGSLRVGVGYEFANFFGLVEGFDFPDDAHPAKMTRRAGDLGLDGVVFRVEYLF